MTFPNQCFLIFLMVGIAERLCAQNCPDANRFFPAREVGRVRANRMDHLSGMAASRLNGGVLWVHNGGNVDQFFALTGEGRPAGTFTLPERLLDLEALAIGPGASAGQDFLYLGDIGDPERQRRTVIVVSVPEPEVFPDDTKARAAAGVVYSHLSYPDSGHDAQALLVDPLSEELYLVTREATRALVFRARRDQLSQASNSGLEQVAALPVGEITGGDISRNGKRIALRSQLNAWIWKRATGQSIQEAFSQAPVQVSLGSETIGRALAWDADGTGFFTVSQGADQPIYFHAENRTRFTIGQPLGVLSEPDLAEVSGVASSQQSPGVVWMLNDGTNQLVSAVNTDGTLLARVRFHQSVVDLEDIALGPGDLPASFTLYLTDIGDNSLARSNIAVIRVPEPDLVAGVSGAEMTFSRESRITLRYPDGAHNAEALLVDPLSGDIYIATKEENRFRLYAASQSELMQKQELTLALVHTGDFALVSGGDISPDGLLVALRREDAARVWKRAPGQSIAEALRSLGEAIPVIGPPQEPNGESLAFVSNDGAYVTFSEGQTQSLYAFQPLYLPRFASVPLSNESGWRVFVAGCGGEHVVIEVSSDLVNWTSTGEIALTGDQTPFVSSGLHEKLFYRLVRP